MELIPQKQLITNWLSFSSFQLKISNELESNLQQKHQLSLNEFYVLLFLSEAPQKKLKLQQLQSMVGLSQSAMSRLVSRFEARDCGALRRHICVDDRRAIYTSLTPEGEEKLNQAIITFHETLENTFSIEVVLEELHQLLDQLKRKRD